MILFVFSGHFAVAREDSCRYVIKGIVIDSTEHTALEMTSVAASGQAKSECRTNKNGYFTLQGLCPGIIELHISHLHCEHIHLQLELRRDTFITVYLKHQVQELEGVKITQTARQQSMSIGSGKTLESGKINSLGSMMQEVQGISLLKSGNNTGKPVVNGLFGNRVIIANNGIRQEGQNWGMEHAPEIDAFLATEIELLKGPEALRYGSDGIGGVVLVKPRSLFAEKKGISSAVFHSGFNSNGRNGVLSVQAGTALNTRIPVYVRIQGTKRQGGNLNTPDYILANTGMREANYSVNTGLKNQHFQTELFFSSFRYTQAIFTGSQAGNLSDLQQAMNSSRPLVNAGFTYHIDRAYQEVWHRLFKSRTEIPLNAKNRLEFVFSYQNNNRKEYDILRSASAYTGPGFNYFIRTGIAEALWSRTDFHGLNYKIGLLYLRQANAYTGRYFIPGFYQNSIAQYVIMSAKITPKSTLEGAMRADLKSYEIFIWNNNRMYNKLSRYPGLTYSGSMLIQANRKNRLNILHSSAWRPPAPNELFADGLHQGLASIEKGDSALMPERSWNLSMGHVHTGKILKAEYELFYQYIHNFINLVPAGYTLLSIRGAYPVFKYTRSDAVLYGINLRIRAGISKHLQSEIQCNLVNGTDARSKQALSMIPPYSGKLNLIYENKNLRMDVWSRYTARQFRYSAGTDFQEPPPAYWLLGADIQYSTSIRKQELRFIVGCSNLGNTSYRDYMNRFRYFSDEPGLNVYARISIPLQLKNNAILQTNKQRLYEK